MREFQKLRLAHTLLRFSIVVCIGILYFLLFLLAYSINPQFSWAMLILIGVFVLANLYNMNSIIKESTQENNFSSTILLSSASGLVYPENLLDEMFEDFISIIADTKKISPLKVNLLIENTDQDNMSAMGSRHGGAILITKKFLLTGSRLERQAGLCHEIHHLLNYDSYFRFIAMSHKDMLSSRLIVFIIPAICFFLGWQAGLLYALLAFPLLTFLLSNEKQATEKLADLYAIQQGYGMGLVSYFMRQIEEKKLSPSIDSLIAKKYEYPRIHDRLIRAINYTIPPE